MVPTTVPSTETALPARRITAADHGLLGVADAARTNIVKAFVVLRVGGEPVTAEGLQDFVKARIAPYKYPRAVEFVTELPKTQTGKLQRFKLRAAPET